jgi:hypothetical protein
VFNVPAVKSFHENYRRLARDPLGLSSLWLGGDHLVYVKGSGFLMPFSEEYRRFRLSEIQALSVAKTSRIGLGLLFLGGVIGGALPASLILLLAESLGGVAAFFVSVFLLIALLAAGLLLRHLVLGPTCLCELQTRLSRERLRPLNRYHFALETVRRIEGLVREAQAEAAFPEVGEETRVVALPPPEPAAFYEVPATATASFGAFALVGLASLASIHLESPVLAGLVLLLLFGASLLLTIALVASVRRATPESIRAVLWTLLGLDFVVLGIGAVYYIVAAAGEPAYTVGITGPLEAFAAIALEGGVVLYGVLVALFAGLAATAGTGLALVAKWRTRLRLAASMQSPRLGPGKEGGE